MSLNKSEMYLIKEGLKLLEDYYIFSNLPESDKECAKILLLLSKVKQIIDEYK